MYHRTHSSMMSASNTRLRYIGSRAIGFVIQNLRPKIRQSTRCPWMHQNPVSDLLSDLLLGVGDETDIAKVQVSLPSPGPLPVHQNASFQREPGIRSHLLTRLAPFLLSKVHAGDLNGSLPSKMRPL